MRFSVGSAIWLRIHTGWSHGEIAEVSPDDGKFAYKIRIIPSGGPAGDEAFAPSDNNYFVRSTEPSAEEKQEHMHMMAIQTGQNAPLRFKEGDEIYCRGPSGWTKATILKNDNPQAKYKIRIKADGMEVYCPEDTENFVGRRVPPEDEDAIMMQHIKQSMMMKQRQMQQQQQQMQMQQMAQGVDGSLMDQGATIEEGPLAEEQVALVRLLAAVQQQSQPRAQKAALMSVLNKKQLKAYEKDEARVSKISDQQAKMMEFQQMQQKLSQDLTMEQRQQVQTAFQAEHQKAQQSHQVMLEEQEENWLGKLTVEQREVWDTILRCSEEKNNNPMEKQQFMRDGQIKIGKMLSEEQQLNMATNMRRIRLGHMKKLSGEASSEGATSVESGPLAEAEEALNALELSSRLSSHLQVLKAILNAKQRKFIAKQEGKAVAMEDPKEAEKLLEKTRKKAQDDLTEEQKGQVESQLQEEVELVKTRFFNGHAEVFEFGLTGDQQGEYEAAKVEAQTKALVGEGRRAFLKEAQSKIGNSFSEEQQATMAEAMQHLKVRLVEENSALQNAEKDKELEAANAMLASMGMA